VAVGTQGFGLELSGGPLLAATAVAHLRLGQRARAGHALAQPA